MDNVVQAKNWSDLNKLLFTESWQDDIKRHRSNKVFRGLSRSYDKELSTTLFRNANANNVKLEENILQSFRKYAYNDLSSHYNNWYWLALAQHHGLPTRLLDWTYSPYVALHFATHNINDYESDGVIWAVDYYETNKFLPDALTEIREKIKSQIFTVETLEREFPDREKFYELEDCILFFEPPALDQRIVNQFGLFSIMPNRASMLHEWFVGKPECYTRIIIPAKLKWEIRNKLDQININERVLFPGYDGLCNWLTRYYGFAPDGCVNTEDMELP